MHEWIASTFENLRSEKSCSLLDIGAVVAKSIVETNSPLMRHMMLLSHEANHPRRDADESVFALLPFPVSSLHHLTKTLMTTSAPTELQKGMLWLWALVSALNYMYVGTSYGKVPDAQPSEAQKIALTHL